MRRVSVNLPALCAYVFVLILTYLAGTYVAHFYFFIYVFMLVLGLYSILQVVLSAATLECIQSVDAEHPAKGDTVHFRVWLAGKPLFTTEITVRFAHPHTRLSRRLPELHASLAGRRFEERTFDIPLRHRGSYSVGIESIRISDALGWFALYKTGTTQSFLVHPRIFPLDPPSAETRVHALSDSGAAGPAQDLTMFEGLAGYREGDPIRYVAWKKYLSTGTPYLKRFGGSSEPAVVLYLDLRLPPGFPAESDVVPTVEDCSIEMAISLVKGYLDRGVAVTVRAAGGGLYTFAGRGPADFARFFEETDGLRLCEGAPSPARMYDADRSDATVEASILFITHIVEERLFEIVSERGRTGEQTGIYLNLTGLNPGERDRAASYGQAVRSSGAGLCFTADADTIENDITQWRVLGQ